MIDLALLAACTPAGIAVETVSEIVRVESGGDPLVLHVNISGTGGQVIHPGDVAAAVRAITQSLQRGNSVDIGLMQLNTSSVGGLGYNWAQLLEPCTNIRVGAGLLREKYEAAARVLPEGQPALAGALSSYNTGSLVRGFANGYVGRYYPAMSVPPAAPRPRREAPTGERDPWTADTAVLFHGSGFSEASRNP